VAEIFRAYRDGATAAAITAEMLGRGVLSPTGRSLSVDQVTHLLENPYYLGKLHWRVPADRQAELGPEIVIRNHHPALIDPVLYDEVQRLRRQRRGGNRALPSERAPRSQRNRRHVPLSDVLAQRREPARTVHGALPPGLTTCGHCGGRIYARLQTRGARGKRYRAAIYECEKHKTLGAAVCPQPPVLVGEIDREVGKRLLEAVSRGRWSTESPGRLPVDTGDLDVRLADLEVRRRRLSASLANAGESVSGLLQKRMEDVGTQITDIEAQRRRRLGEHRQAEGSSWDLLRDPGRWEDFDPATRRRVLQDLLAKAVIHERRLAEFELALPRAADGETAA
jgi:hypothetical protein